MAVDLEDRVQDLERRVSEWEGQMGFLLPLTKQLHREAIAINEKVDRLEGKVDAGFAATLEQFQQVEPRFNSIDQRFNGFDERFGRVEADISEIKANLDALPRAVAEIITKRS